MMDQDHSKEIERIMGQIECPKGFQCYQSGFETLCKAKAIEGELLKLVCLEAKPLECKFLSIKRGFICECPLRLYLAKHLKK